MVDGLIVDESTDIVVTKNLILYARVVKNCTVTTLFLKNTEMLDVRAIQPCKRCLLSCCTSEPSPS